MDKAYIANVTLMMQNGITLLDVTEVLEDAFDMKFHYNSNSGCADFWELLKKEPMECEGTDGEG